MDDPYKILGVTKGASQDDIRRAYRKLAKKHHPDLNPDDAKAEDVFKGVTAANNLLSDPERRARFDRGEIDASGQEQGPRSSCRDYAEGAAGKRYSRGVGEPGGWSDDFDEIFGSAFGRARGGRASDGTRRGSDEHYALTTQFLNAIKGATQPLTLGSDSGSELRLRGRGVPEHSGKAAGDLYATLRFVIGPPDDALTAFLEGWKPERLVNPRHRMEPQP